MRKEKRSPFEEITDQILLLYLINKTEQCGDVDGDTKLQKLVFLSEKNMIKSKIKGFNFYFFKFLHGPFSRELEEDLGVLQEWGAYLPDENMLTTAGMKAIELFPEIWSRNNRVTSEIDTITKQFAQQPLRSILSYVYNLEHPFYRTKKKIIELKNHTPILFRMEESKAMSSFSITESELESLDILFDFDTYSDLIDPDEEADESVPYPGV